MGDHDSIMPGFTIIMIKYKLYELSKFGQKYFYMSGLIIIIVPEYVNYWDNFFIDVYSNYIKQKFISNLNNINLN